MRTIEKNSSLIFVLLLFFLYGGILFAVSSESWKQRGPSAFIDGFLDKVSITGEGHIILSPPLAKIASIPEKALWMLAEDEKNQIYVATGNEGRIYKISSGDQAELFFDAEEMEVHAIAFDHKGALFAATSPAGKIYKLDKSGSSTVFCDVEDKYIWAMAFDPEGSLYIATGEKGRIYKISPEGDRHLFYQSNVDHIRTMIFDEDGSLIVGTSGTGLIMRIDPKGQAFVLFDSSRQEISSLALSQKGIIYAAAVGEKLSAEESKKSNGLGFPVEVVKVVASKDTSSSEVQKDMHPSMAEKGGEEKIVKGGSEILKIERSGFPRQIWRSSKEVVHSLLLDNEGNLLAGTGNEGIIYRIDKDEKTSTLMKMADHQVTSMLPSLNRILIGSSNNATVSFIERNFSTEGMYQSQVKDTGSFSSWGMFHSDYEAPEGTKILFYMRTGNTKEPDEMWSPWKKLTMRNGSSPIDSPNARFIQWKAELQRKEPVSHTPMIKSSEVHFLPENLTPEIRKIEIHPPGIFYQLLPVPQIAGSEIPASFNRSKTKAEKSLYTMKVKPPIKKVYQYGKRTVSWEASDLNGDDLIFSIYYKGAEEREWKTLEKEITESFFSWESRLMADGDYLIRVVASDSPSNPESYAKEAEKESQPFVVDNTPPSVSSINWSHKKGQLTVSFSVEDLKSHIENVEYSINASDWKILFPDDKVYDSQKEAFRFTRPLFNNEEYTLVIQAMDAAGNIGSGKAIITIDQ